MDEVKYRERRGERNTILLQELNKGSISDDWTFISDHFLDRDSAFSCVLFWDSSCVIRDIRQINILVTQLKMDRLSITKLM